MFWDVLSTFMNVVGDLKSGSAQQKAATFDANLDKYNQGVATQEGQVAQITARQQGAQRLGVMRANVGASGMDVTAGSGMDMLYSNAYQSEIDARNTKYNFDVKAQGYGMAASLATSRAANAGSAGYISAASSLLKGAASSYRDTSNPAAPFSLGG